MMSHFFAFEGIDGTGKSTQLHLLSDWLRACGQDVVTCRDPGSTPLGERLREVVLGIKTPADGAESMPVDSANALEIDDSSEILIYMAARAQLVRQIVRPALDAGRTVVSDRYLLSTVAYQGYGGGQTVEAIWEVGHFATGGLMPTLTFVLDLPPEIAASRLQGGLDRMESKGIAYFGRVREGFLSEARKSPETIVVLDARQSVQELQDHIRARVRELV